MTASALITSLGNRGCGMESYNALRDDLLSVGQERLANGCERHQLTSLDQVYDMLNGPYGWETADLSSAPAAIRSLIRILDSFNFTPDEDLLDQL